MKRIALAGITGCCVASAMACGGWFPNELLPYGGEYLLTAPEASFSREIQTLQLVKPTHRAVSDTNGFAVEVAAAELAELRSALVRTGRSTAEAEEITRRHAIQRERILDHSRAFDQWQASQNPWLPSTNPPPLFDPESVTVTAGLPGEFADYFRGAIAWHAGDTNAACAAWQALLNRPEAERHFRSTWAAFMLGKATWATNPSQAARHFREVRALVGRGFADSIGLAASSLGWEARITLRRDDFAGAIDLYLEQASAGDDTAYSSLRFAARAALTRGRNRLPALAGSPRAQAVITAYIIAGGWNEAYVDTDGVIYEPIANLLDRQPLIPSPAGGWHRFESPVTFWLEAVEKADIRDVASAEKLALAAYQAGEFDEARRWVRRAPESPTAQWLDAKLLLRDGKTDRAAAVLAGLSRQFPADASETAPPSAQTNLLLRLHLGPLAYVRRDSPTQLQAEFGALRLTRREYTEALDALLRSSYWNDAAYVADRVLTIDELVQYVDHHWQSPTPPDTDQAAMRSHIRTLLGLRLVRLGEFKEALAYLPANQLEVLNQYMQAIATGRDTSRSAAERAAALWQGAQTVFASYGLFTPPVDTDWRLDSGLFTFSPAPPGRLNPGPRPQYLPASSDEQLRVANTSAYPDRTWYYRYIATGLAWEAAQLMPDNTDETAHVLWQAGTWIKYADPKAADVFYKALVNRCRKTALGDAADHRRWFPSLDQNGNILPYKSRITGETRTASSAAPQE